MKKFTKIVSIVICIALFTLSFASCKKLKDFTYDGDTLTDASYGKAYSASVATAVGEGNPAITYTIKTGTLPAGLAFDNGVISGTPTALTSGEVKITVVAKASGFNEAEAQFGIKVVKGNITYNAASLSQATVGVAYTASVATATAMSGTAFTYELKTTDSLPAGLSFNNGAITGTPTAASSGEVRFTVTAKAANYNDAEAEFSISVAKGNITYSGTELAAAKVGVAYSANVATALAMSGTAFTYEIKQSSSLPAGLTINNGVISGTPTEATNSASTFIVVAKAANFVDQEAEFSITVSKGTINYSSASLADGEVGKAYSASVKTAAPVGSATVTYALKEAGSLPAGLTFDNGTISGTPTAPVNAKSFTVVASADNYNSAERTFTITIEEGAISYEGTSYTGKVGETFNKDLRTATADGAPQITYTSTSTLPAGLTFNNGVISGTPTQKTTVQITVTAGASGYTSKSAEFSIAISNAGEIAYSGISLSAKVGVALNRSIATAEAGSATITYTLASGTLPNGLTFNNGVISGTPTTVTASPATITVLASAVGFDSASADFTVSVAAGTIVYANLTLTAGSVGNTYSQTAATATAQGSLTPTISYALASGSTLPQGLTMSSAGVISGTPSIANDFTFSIVASAANFSSTTASISLTVSPGSINYSAATLTAGTSGTAYSQSVATASVVGTVSATITYALKAGSTLPQGLTMTSAGLISGTPSVGVRNYTFTVVASADNFRSAEAVMTISINALVTFNLNYTGATAPSIQTVAVGGTVTATTPTRAAEHVIWSSAENGRNYDYKYSESAFVGWFTDQTLTTQFNTSAPVMGNMQLYAKWDSTYTFEAEFTDLTGKVGPGYSQSKNEEQMIIFDTPTLNQNASFSHSVGYLYEYGLFLEFKITSDRAVSNAVLVARLSAEFRDCYIAPSNTTVDGKNYSKFTFLVNGVALQYDPIAMTGAKGYGNPNQRPYDDHTINLNVNLIAGVNTIRLRVDNNTDFESTIVAMAPMVDCIKITTDANLTWSPKIVNMDKVEY